MKKIEDRAAWKVNGYLMFFVGLALLFLSATKAIGGKPIFALILLILALLCLKGIMMINPNNSRVLTLFGKYTGTVKESGLFWTNPFVSKDTVSLRVRNFESEQIKVNDADGNPIMIKAVVVWKVVDSAKAMFDIDDYDSFVKVQSETAIRGLSSKYPYDSHTENKISLRGDPEHLGSELKAELHGRLNLAGVEVVEARISHLSYAPEIAQSMLRRQQAQAILAAREQIVEGALGMVEAALQRLERDGVVKLDEERKAAMANNLLVALVSEGGVQPVVNTGTLYS